MNPLIALGLCIRPFRKADAPAFAAAVRESVSTVGPWMPWCHEAYSIDEAESWFAQCKFNLESGFAYDLGIFGSDERTLLGSIGINQINPEHKIGNIGYWVRQTRQRQGIATKAVRIIADFGFRQLKLTRLEIVVVQGNHASRRVAEKAGATFECIARNRLILHDRPHPAAVYSLIPEDDLNL